MTADPGERDWYTKAGVRKDPRRLLRDELRTGQLYFPPSLVPYTRHPRVTELPDDAREALLARHLFQYLHFTTQFETRVVNRATDLIASGRSGLHTPPETRLNAYRIYCDEGYHALYSYDVVRQVSDASGIAPLPYDFTPFLTRLDAVGTEVLPGEPVLAQLLQVVVFETLVTAILNDVPKDQRVLTVVRDTVRDHARDEGWHHAFFARFFRDLWAGLTPALRVRVARCLPGLIRSSLLPDLRPVHAALLLAGLSPARAEEVVRDCYPRDRVEADMRSAARHALRLFEETGVLDVDGGRDAFHAEGLLPGRHTT
ncbi:diiron oxygenase [Streptomyces sp. TRM S81-3]|uniref:Diiron oxygenase n=1 Tax=Streptomyces griseicoloratus TaxID=2752516 RepID=A0A926QR90_9ACTN|nr:diiron oxygenase [Streptomyces griseicoloratus]MBD0421629.1 diiron oxygenase [Streptomyces griseicoloratus]